MNLDDAEKLKELVVDPMIATIRAELTPLVKKVEKHDGDIVKLKRNQGRALVGFGGMMAGLSLVVGLIIDWMRRKLGI